MCTELDELMQVKEIHYSPDTSNNGLKHSIPILLKVMDSPKCSNVDIDWYVRMITNPPPVNTLVETALKLCEEEDAFLEAISPAIDHQFQHSDG